MSHTTKIHKATFIHDGDFFGDVTITYHLRTLIIPFATLREFVAEHVRNEKIKELEEMHPDKLLGTGVFK